MSDPYAGLPPEYLALLKEGNSSAEPAVPPAPSSPTAPPPPSSRQPTPEEEEEMDRYYSQANWMDTGETSGAKRAEPSTYWYPSAIGDGQ
ncbi:hypothetical protein [Nocardia rhizosphaerae]|uniref:Uncharacterized protein n=1 Tax=Nocardia rhizosphaerae TaxID=1691571 RepID=A0ABV8L699_9NOCA